MAQIIDGKYIIELDELTNIELVDWIPFQPNTVPEQAYRISLTNFIKALPIIPAVAGEYANIAAMLAAQGGQTADVFYKVADPSDDPDYNDLKDSEIKSVYYHLVEEKTASLSDYNSIAIPKLESSKFPKLGNSLEALTFDVKFRSAEWSSNKATLQAIANALKLSSPQDLLLDALSLKLNTDNNPADISRVLFGIDGQLIFEPINSAKIQSDSDSGDVTLNDSYQLLLTITGNQNIANGIANIGLTAKSFSTGAITAFAASGNNRVRATSAVHGFSEGDYVEIVNTANYNDIVEIKAVPNINDFDFTATFVATETGDWEKSENREIAVDLRVNAISAKEFTRQIEGEGRLNFSEQLSGLVNGEDITVYVKSNTLGETIEILGSSQSSELKFVNSDIGGGSATPNFGTEAIKTLVSGVATAGSDRNLLIAAESGVVDDMIELTGLSVGDKVQLRADSGDTITVKHNDAGATIKILLQNGNDINLSETNPLELSLVSAGELVQSFRDQAAGGGAQQFRVAFDSDLDTVSPPMLMRGDLSTLAMYAETKLDEDATDMQARLDSTDTWTDITQGISFAATVANLLTWVNANVGAGVQWEFRLIITYDASETDESSILVEYASV